MLAFELAEKIETNVLESNLTLKAFNKEEHVEVTDKKLQHILHLECLQCVKSFNYPLETDEYLAHLYVQHRLVIADVEDIADLKEYLVFWKHEFRDHKLEEYCTTMLLDQLPDGTAAKNERYYLLSDILPKDSELRQRLYSDRLEKALAQHQYERSDRNFKRECLYCRDVIEGLRSEYVAHLFNKHFLQLGKPEKLVYIDELVNVVQENLSKLICLFCEKIFKDRTVLKEHMRKKGHKRINPDNKFYDKFFLINYQNEVPGKASANSNTRAGFNTTIARKYQRNSSNRQFYQDAQVENDDPDDWCNWDIEKPTLTCLFCRQESIDFQQLKDHMNLEHLIDFDSAVANLNFYEKMKVVNYVRRQMHILRCVTCNEKFETSTGLREHLALEKHCGIGDRKKWDHPEFFFPTYEDDGILWWHLDDETFATDQESVRRRFRRRTL